MPAAARSNPPDTRLLLLRMAFAHSQTEVHTCGWVQGAVADLSSLSALPAVQQQYSRLQYGSTVQQYSTAAVQLTSAAQHQRFSSTATAADSKCTKLK